MATISDPEFGEISVQKHAMAKNIGIKMLPSGKLKIIMPTYAPAMSAKLLLKTSRASIRQMVSKHQQSFAYLKDAPIGKSHHLYIKREGDSISVKISASQIVAKIPASEELSSLKVQSEIRKKVITALRKEAKSHLPRRLRYHADQHGFDYDAVRLTHASSRWGSCSSGGTISLNIALMNLPFELMDYVLIHELAHTRQMNHSNKFWQEVAAVDPLYKQHRKQLKNHTPYV